MKCLLSRAGGMLSVKGLLALCMFGQFLKGCFPYEQTLTLVPSKRNSLPLIHTHKHLSTKFLPNSPLCELSVSLSFACLSFPPSDFSFRAA